MKRSRRYLGVILAQVVVLSMIVTTGAGAAATNDDLDNALLITDGYAADIDSTGATLDDGGVSGTCQTGSPNWSIWYRFSAASTGNVFLQTRMPTPNATNFMAVYDLTLPSTLGSEVGCGAGTNVNQLIVPVIAGSDYAVQVVGNASDLGDLVTLEFETMGTLEGTVTEEGTGDPLSPITVQVLDTTGTKLLAITSTIGNGTWSVGVPTREVIVHFSDPVGDYGTLYYENVILKSDATPIVVTEGATTSGIDAEMADAGSMSGTITSSSGGDIEGAFVAIYDAPTPAGPVDTAITVSDGTYSMTGLAPGDYFVQFSGPNHFGEWYDDVDNWNPGGTTITIVAGLDTVVDAELLQGGAISGEVTDDFGNPIAGVTVEIYSGSGSLAYNDTTDVNGLFSAQPIAPGTYAVFADTSTVPGLQGAYGMEWWDNLPASTAYVDVGKIEVSGGSVDIADFSLTPSMISGTVTSLDDSLPVAGVVVTLRNSLAESEAETTTDAGGSYSFDTFAFSNPPLTLSFEATSAFFEDATTAPFAFAAGDVEVVDRVLSVDQQAPVVDPAGPFSIPEDSPAGTAVGTAVGSDANRADTITWSITSGNTGGAFSIDTATGAVTTATGLDFETTPSYVLTVTASDGALEGSTDVVVDVTDINEAIPSAGFTDTVGSVFEANIDWMAYVGITKGCNPPTNDLFCPEGDVTRGQMAAFLVRALNLTDRLDNPFTDDDGSIFEADIERLAAAGITKGCNPPTNDLFCPEDKVTREQMAAFLVRALGYVDAGSGDLFTDDDDSIFEADIDRLATAGVTKGCNPSEGNTKFCPTNFVTRGQMAAFLFRALGG